MDLGAVYAEMKTKLSAGVPNLRVVNWSEKPPVPSAQFLLPESMARGTYRGMFVVKDVQLLIVVGRATARTGLTDMFNYAAAAATAIDPQTWTSCADVTLTETTFGTVTFAGQPDAYLGAVLHLDITGTGA